MLAVKMGAISRELCKLVSCIKSVYVCNKFAQFTTDGTYYNRQNIDLKPIILPLNMSDIIK